MALYVNALLWSIPLQRSWSDAILRAEAGRWWLGGLGVGFAAVVICIAVALALRARRGANPRTLAAAAFAYGGFVWYLSPVPDEVVHLAEYGVLGLCFWWAIDPKAGKPAAWVAVTAAGGVGLIDEWVQHAVPGRVFDWRDVWTNLASALLPVWALASGGETRRGVGGA